MRTIETVGAMQDEADAARASGRRLVLVPTMGALHAGHLALVAAAHEAGDHVTVSVFVNPTQFSPGEDFERYPRTLDADRALLAANGGVDVVFAPSVDGLYADGPPISWVTVDRLGEHLCGARREGHFRGVTTVVTKLFNACRPHAAVFGLKDAQQYFILRRMVRDLLMGIELIGVPTLREADGLALSSRNRYLGSEERAQAVVLSQAVFAARDAVVTGERDGRALAARLARTIASAPGVQLDYADVVDADFLQPIGALTPGRTVLAAVAAFVGRARLIDNTIVRVPEA